MCLALGLRLVYSSKLNNSHACCRTKTCDGACTCRTQVLALLVTQWLVEWEGSRMGRVMGRRVGSKKAKPANVQDLTLPAYSRR